MRKKHGFLPVLRPAVLVTVLLMISACSIGQLDRVSTDSAFGTGEGDRTILSWIKGVDASEALGAERGGVQFRDTNNAVKPALQIFKDHGYTWVRIRLMVDPDGRYALFQNLDYVKTMAKDAKNRGFKFLLDFHYSHWWADPGNQWIPSRWAGQNVATLEASVRAYTKDVITQLRNQGTMPDMVQIGNEINGGMLWEVGRLSNMANFVRLTNAGANGVNDGRGSSPMPPIMVHIAKDLNPDQMVTWYRNFINAGGWVDVIGISYYPMWHGNLTELKNTITKLRQNFSWASVVVVEAAYYWSTNQKGYTGLPYPQTQQGQYDYLRALKSAVQSVGGAGIFYWGAHWSQSPKWLIAPGWGDDDASRRSLFDDNARATKGIDGL